jgi:hypothetical protein
MYRKNLAIDWVNEQDKPWFCGSLYCTSYTPFHAPPTGCITGSFTSLPKRFDAIPYYMAAIEQWIIRLHFFFERTLSRRKNQYNYFIGDNGTKSSSTSSLFCKYCKGTLYEGGINCPLFVSGNGVSRTGTVKFDKYG